jgi:hypothetical protein
LMISLSVAIGNYKFYHFWHDLSKRLGVDMCKKYLM